MRSMMLKVNYDNHQKPAIRKMTDAEKRSLEERRIEINYLRHLKKKYPLEDARITEEANRQVQSA